MGTTAVGNSYVQNVPVSDRGIDRILESKEQIQLVFDATSAIDHIHHAKILEKHGIKAVDLIVET